MRLLLAQHSVYVPTFGGANKSNRLLMEALAQRGHDCRVVAIAAAPPVRDGAAALLDELKARQIAIVRQTDRATIFTLNGVDVHGVSNAADLGLYLRREATTFEPDWLLVSSEDPGQGLLDAAVGSYPSRVVYLARTTLALPCGPDAAAPSAHRTSLLQRTAGVIAVSAYIQRYLARWADVAAVQLPISLYGPGPFPTLASYDRGAITMINPCALKGLSIFLALADAFPDWSFAAVPTWGTTGRERDLLAQRPNVTILAPSDRIEDILSRARAVVVPSLWAEARARIITESMMYGIPVLASDVGGTAEAMGGVDYLLPVVPIATYDERLDERLLPVPDVPPQPIDAWIEALRDLFSSRRRYETVSAAAHAVGGRDVATRHVGPFEQYLHALTPRPPAYAVPTQTSPGATATPTVGDGISARRSLLAATLLAKTTPRGDTP